MPKKGYKHTEEHKHNVSKALKGNNLKNSGQFKKGHIPWIKGKTGFVPWNKGKTGIYSEETLEKLRIANIGKTMSEETKRKISETEKGRKFSKETRAKLSKARKGKECSWEQGEKHHNWKGGITPENINIRNKIENRLWRDSVFARDNWTCQICKVRGSTDLHAHHIKNFSQYPEIRTAISNGITFCKHCHRQFHKIYGIQNNNQEQIDLFRCYSTKG